MLKEKVAIIHYKWIYQASRCGPSRFFARGAVSLWAEPLRAVLRRCGPSSCARCCVVVDRAVARGDVSLWAKPLRSCVRMVWRRFGTFGGAFGALVLSWVCDALSPLPTPPYSTGPLLP